MCDGEFGEMISGYVLLSGSVRESEDTRVLNCTPSYPFSTLIFPVTLITIERHSVLTYLFGLWLLSLCQSVNSTRAGRLAALRTRISPT